MAQCHKCAAFIFGRTDSDTGFKDADVCGALPQDARTDNEEQMLIVLESVLFTLAEMDRCPQFTEERHVPEPQVDVPDTYPDYTGDVPVSDELSDFAFDAARERRIFGK